MAGKSTISITFKLDGDAKGFKDLTQSADGLKKAMNAAVTEAQGLNGKALNFAAITTGISQAQQSLVALRDAMQGLADSYANATQLNIQLTTVMRQRMGATDSDIKAINDVITAQKNLGVIGGLVQKSGAQQIATFLKERSSLETLIPAMNNLLAQQRGLNATQEDAYSVANLMGKAMQGQTSALRRVGITFNDTQEQVMKYGTESQRAAMLAQIITDNVGQMNAELGKTDMAKQKRLEASLASIKVKIGGIVQQGLPYVSMAAQSLILVGSLVKLGTTVKTVTAVMVSWDLRGKAVAVTMSLLGLRTTQTAAVTRVFSAAMTSGAYTATAFKIALRGLMIATAVGAAFVAVTAIIEHFVSANDKAAQSADGFSAVQEKQREAAQKTAAAREAETASINEARAALEVNITRLKDFKGSKEEEKKIVDELNNAYGSTMGYFSSVSDWYKALVKNSQAYCDQMILEAKTRRLANQIAEKEQTISDALNGRGLPDGAQIESDLGVDAVTGGGGTTAVWIRQQEAEVRSLRKELNDTVAAAKKLQMPVKGAATPSSKNKTNTPKVTPDKSEETRYQKLGTLIDEAKEKYVSASQAERAELANKIAGWKAERQQIELLQKQAEQPLELKSIEDIDTAISYQQELRKIANREAIAGIDEEIARLEKLRSEFDKTTHVDIPIDAVHTYKQLNDELNYYNELLQDATEGERPNLQKHINQLNSLKATWDDTLASMEAPGAISTLNSFKSLDDAIRYYQDLQNRQSADEIQNTQKTIDALEAKRKALQLGTDLPSMQREIDEINSLSSREFKLKIKSIGFDELTAKIRELQKALNDTQNPVTESQRQQITGMIATYEQWRKTSVSAFDTVKDGWGGVRGIGDSISSVTQALEGNGNAWQKLTAVIDGFIQLYESVNAIVGIIQLLTTATIAHTAAKTAEGAATTASTAAQGAEVATQGAAAAAAVPVIIANKLVTASYMELASAMYFAAHAAIPFAGFGIAAGFVAAATAVVQSIGVMPFAKGGVVSGPTLALVGEYAGAGNNPEVIAPLDKLRSMLEPQSGIGGKVRFEIEGRKLVGVIANETKVSSKSGRKPIL